MLSVISLCTKKGFTVLHIIVLKLNEKLHFFSQKKKKYILYMFELQVPKYFIIKN